MYIYLLLRRNVYIFFHKHEKFKTWLACEAEIQSVTSARQWWASLKQSILFVILRVMVAKALQKESGLELIELSVGHNPWWSLLMKKVIWNRESWCLEQSWLQNRGENNARVNVRQWKNWVWEKGCGSCRQKLSFRLLKDFSDTFHWWFGRLGAQIGYPHALALKLFQICDLFSCATVPFDLNSTLTCSGHVDRSQQLSQVRWIKRSSVTTCGNLWRQAFTTVAWSLGHQDTNEVQDFFW